MAYSKFEQAYVNTYMDTMYPMEPEEPAQPDTMLAAAPTADPMGQVSVSGFTEPQVVTDAQPQFGVARPIPQNKAQEALGYIGELLTKAGVQLDKVGIDIPVLGRVSLKDLTVGESGKVLEDMALGFYPIEGAGGFISGTTRVNPDAALELLNIAPTAAALTKLGGKAAIKGVTKAVEAAKSLTVGNSIKMVDGSDVAISKAPKVESKAFKNWFGESKVVDESNKPIVVYHGTKDDIEQFMKGQPNKKDAGWLGDGFYFTDKPELASTYAQYLKSGPEGANVLPVYLSIKNPYEATIRDKEYLMMADRRGDKAALKEFTDNLIKQGYDGVVLDYKKQMGVTDPVKEYVAFKPEQIKSVFNKGEFNPQDPRLMYGSGAAGTGAVMQKEENK
jgi:hypothetical protein